MARIKGFYKKDGKTRPITSRQPHAGTMQRGNAHLGIPKRLMKPTNLNVPIKEEKVKPNHPEDDKKIASEENKAEEHNKVSDTSANTKAPAPAANENEEEDLFIKTAMEETK